MDKLNLVRWLKAMLKRDTNDTHVVEIEIYDNGRLVASAERKYVYDFRPSRFEAMKIANSYISEQYSLERRKMKGRA